jgi:uncharacterized protein (TIGR02217 family)
VLQLEDYDWVTSGNHGATSRGIPAMTERLGYPVAEQHYFSGFVLTHEDQFQWRDIALAAQASINRGTAQTYIWALPQVARDGFTYFEISDGEESEVQVFDDINFPLAIGQQATVTTEFSTNIVTTLSGHERRNSDWADARASYDVSPGIRSEAELGILFDFFRARRGPAIGFRFHDPFDHSSNGMTGTPQTGDQTIGIGNGLRTEFQLIKSYGQTATAQSRKITRPVAGSVLVSVNGVAASNWTLVEGGKIQFATSPPAGAQIKAGYYFDVPVRFASDRIEANRFSFEAGEMPSVPLIQIKEAP